MKSKQELRQLEITADDDLGAMEKETSLTFPNDVDYGRIHTDVPTLIKWVLSIDESDIEDYRLKEGAIVDVRAIIPKGIVKLQGNARKSNAHSQMATYGPHK